MTTTKSLAKIGPRFITVADTRVGVTYSTGPWIEGVDPATVKIRPRRATRFPDAFLMLFAIENNSDSLTDYYESDCIRLVPGHAWYNEAQAAATEAR